MNFARVAVVAVFLFVSLPTFTAETKRPKLSANQIKLHIQLLMKKAMEQNKADDLVGAIKTCRQILAIHNNPRIRYNLVCLLAATGKKEEALKELKQAVEDGFTGHQHMEKDKDLDSLRKDPSFTPLVERAKELEKIRIEKMKNIKPAEPVFVFPKNMDKSGVTKYPLLVTLHGRGSHAYKFGLGMGRFTQRMKMIQVSISGSEVLSPDGRRFGWHLHDAKRAQEIVKKTIEAYPVNPDRVYVFGFSQGGVMAYPVGFGLADQCRGIVSLAGSLPKQHISSSVLKDASKKIPVVVYHGTKDPVMKYELAKKAEVVLQEEGFAYKMETFEEGHVFPKNFGRQFPRLIKWIDKKADELKREKTPADASTAAVDTE